MFCMDLCNNNKKVVMISKSCQASPKDIDTRILTHTENVVYKELVDKMEIHKNHRIYI